MLFVDVYEIKLQIIPIGNCLLNRIGEPRFDATFYVDITGKQNNLSNASETLD